MTERVVVATVPASDDGERLDRAAAALFAADGLSRSVLTRLCTEGRVLVRDVVGRPSQRVRAGDRIEVRVPPPEPSTAVAEDIPLTILHEDEAVLVVDKPAGLVVHPARGHATGTLVNAVLHHAALDDDGASDSLRPGIVHRLDKDTSGVLVVAKTVASREHLKAQFQAHSIERSYLGIALSRPPARVTYDTLHGRHATDRLRFTSRVREGKRAVTHVTSLERFAHATLVRCELETGRTHQIRMHLAEAGYPLLGDPLYGIVPKDPTLRALGAALGRQALHAAVLGFDHPTEHRRVRFESPLPDDLARTLAALRADNR